MCFPMAKSDATKRGSPAAETEIVEIWSRLIEQHVGNVILFGMSNGLDAQDTNPTRQLNLMRRGNCEGSQAEN